MFEDGVWRTVGGRKIFIKNGVDLKTAMKESGKFKKNEIKDKKQDNKEDDLKENNNEEKIKELEKQFEKAKGIFAKGKIQEEIEALKKVIKM